MAMVHFVAMAPEAVVIAAVVVTIALPGGRPIADGGLCATDNCEVSNQLLCLLPTIRALDLLEHIAHGHSTLGSRAAGTTVIFVQGHPLPPPGG
jgi:hypothetical protein